MTTLKITWGISRGRDTYGYNLVTLYIDGVRYTRTCGGGYDMQGTVLGEYITGEYNDRLKTLTANYGSLDNTKGYYGLSFYSKKDNKRHNTYQEGDSVHVDGACGSSAVQRIADAIGLDLRQNNALSNRKASVWFISEKTT